MSSPQTPLILTSQTVTGTLFNTFTTAKSVINATELLPLPGNYVKLGAKFRQRVVVGLSNIVTTPGTVAFQLRMGSVVAQTSGNIQLSTTANTHSTVEIDSTVRLWSRRRLRRTAPGGTRPSRRRWTFGWASPRPTRATACRCSTTTCGSSRSRAPEVIVCPVTGSRSARSG